MTTSYEDALSSLTFRYERAPEDAIITVHTWNADDGFTAQGFSNTANEREHIASLFADKPFDVWTRISTVPRDIQISRKARGTEQQTYGVTTLHVDVDPDLDENETLKQWQERKLVELQMFEPRPSRIEFSGRGYYALWAIEFTTDWERCKRINKWLSVQLGGDKCFDVARILRLPGTLNPKPDATWSKTIESYPHLCELGIFQEADLTVTERKAQSLEFQPEVLPLDFEASCRAASEKLWARIYSESTAREAGAEVRSDRTGRIDRSENDFYIACALLRMRQSPGVVYSVLTHERWFSGEKFRDSGYRDGYVTYTITAARDMAIEEPITKAPPLADYVEDKYNIRCYLKDWFYYNEDSGVYEPGEMFIRRVVQALSGEKWRAELQSGVFNLLEARHGVTVTETNPTRYINVLNGMLDPTTGARELHAPSFRSFTQINAEWNPSVDTTEVDNYVSAVLPKDTIDIWWMFCGYCLHMETPLPWRGILFLVGPPRTGKSQLLAGLREFLGRGNCSSIPLNELTDDRTQFTTSNLVGKLLNVDSEASYRTPIKKIDLLKALGSGEAVDIEKKYAGKQSLELPVKLAFAMNGNPRIGVADEALYDRMVMIKVEQTEFSRDNPSTRPNAARALLSRPENRSAWLLRSVQGLQQIGPNKGIPETASTKEAKLDLRVQEDSIYAYWDAATTPSEEFGPLLSLGKFYRVYVEWCKDRGVFPENAHMFTNHTRELVAGQQLVGVHLKHSNQWMISGRTIAYGITVRGNTERDD